MACFMVSNYLAYYFCDILCSLSSSMDDVVFCELSNNPTTLLVYIWTNTGDATGRDDLEDQILLCHANTLYLKIYVASSFYGIYVLSYAYCCIFFGLHR